MCSAADEIAGVYRDVSTLSATFMKSPLVRLAPTSSECAGPCVSAELTNVCISGVVRERR